MFNWLRGKAISRNPPAKSNRSGSQIILDCKSFLMSQMPCVPEILEQDTGLADRAVDVTSLIIRDVLRRARLEPGLASDDEVFAATLLLFVVADVVTRCADCPFEETSVLAMVRVWGTRLSLSAVGPFAQQIGLAFNQIEDEPQSSDVARRVRHFVESFLVAPNTEPLDNLAKSLLYLASATRSR